MRCTTRRCAVPSNTHLPTPATRTRAHILSLVLRSRETEYTQIQFPPHNIYNMPVVYVGLGSNMGCRMAHLRSALTALRAVGERVRASHVYETAPMHLTNQAPFLNAAVRLTTDLDPLSLLAFLKKTEAEAGRKTGGVRNGPRPLDLDVLMYENVAVDHEDLVVPHPRISERPFVLRPLLDVLEDDRDIRKFRDVLHNIDDPPRVQRVYPGTSGYARSTSIQDSGIPRIFGVLNITPDSFSDGGRFCSTSGDGVVVDVERAVDAALRLVEAGATVVDVGAESTRPGGDAVDPRVQIDRALRSIERIHESVDADDVSISIDTTSSIVAKEAIRVGASIVNDVSGGRDDPLMFKTVATAGVPIVLMHRRGPDAFSSTAKTYANGVVLDASFEMRSAISDAESAGVPRWDVVVDPGLGFSKTPEQSYAMLRDLDRFHSAVGHAPLLIGASRKAFLGSDRSPVDRDHAHSALCAWLMREEEKEGDWREALSFRVHDVSAARGAFGIARRMRDGVL